MASARRYWETKKTREGEGRRNHAKPAVVSGNRMCVTTGAPKDPRREGARLKARRVVAVNDGGIDAAGGSRDARDAGRPARQMAPIEPCDREDFTADAGRAERPERLTAGAENHMRPVARGIEVLDGEQQGALGSAEKRRPREIEDGARRAAGGPSRGHRSLPRNRPSVFRLASSRLGKMQATR